MANPYPQGQWVSNVVAASSAISSSSSNDPIAGSTADIDSAITMAWLSGSQTST